MNIKDMVYALFGNYANSAKVELHDQKTFLANAANGVSYVTKSPVKHGKTVFDKLGEKQINVFKATFGARSEIFAAIDIIKYLDISQQIIETVVNDAFYSFDSKEPFTIEYIGDAYDAEEINARIQRTIQRLKLYQVFKDIADDLVTYGEYYLETPCKQGLGIAEINDTVFVNNVISIYDNYELLYHVAERKTNYGTEIVQVDKDSLSHFVLDSKRIRTRAGKFSNIVGVPEVVKVGRSILLPVLKLLQRYNLLDIASIAQDLKTALMPPIVKLGVSDQMTPEQLIDAVKKYEEYFTEMGDSLHSIDASKEVNPQDILRLATQVKIVPSSDKSGALEKQDFASSTNLNESQDRLVSRIKGTIGIPSDEEQKSRLDNLREKSRYAKKLLDIQDGTAHSVSNLILKDLKYQGIIIDESNIAFKFKAIQNPNIEEDAEGMFHLASSARDVIRTYVETAEDIGGLKINPAKAKKFIETMMSRFSQCDGMLELDAFSDAEIPGEDENFNDREIEDAGFGPGGDDGTENGPESVGPEDQGNEEPLIDEEPTETEEPAGAEEPADTGEES